MAQTNSPMTDPTFKVEKVDPKRATNWLKINHSNRNPSDATVSFYVADMKEGNWQFTGAPILFDKEGKLIDGQHRLMAVVASGTTQEFLIGRNLDIKAQIVIDTGRKRSLSDQLKFHGYKDVNNLGAGTRLAYQLYHYQVVQSRNKPTTSQTLIFLIDHPELVEMCKLSAKPFSEVSLVRSVGVGTMFVMYETHPEEAEQFWTEVMYGEGLRSSSPTYQLRKKLLANASRPHNNRFNQQYLTAIVLRAWNLWRQGAECQVLSWRATRDPNASNRITNFPDWREEY